MKRFSARMLLVLSCLSVLSVGTLQAAGVTWYDYCVAECNLILIDCEFSTTNPNRDCIMEYGLCLEFCDSSGIP